MIYVSDLGRDQIMWEVFNAQTGETVATTTSAYRARRIVSRPGNDMLDYALAGSVSVEPAGCLVRPFVVQGSE